MGPSRIIILVVAAIASIVLMVIVGRLISHKPAPPPVAEAPPKPMTRVVVAAHDLTIGERLSPQDLTWQSWPKEAVNPAFITDNHTTLTPPPTNRAASVANQTGQAASDAVNAVTGGRTPMDALYGAIVKTPILANEPVTNSKIVRGGEGGYMAVVLRPGMRAVAMPVSVNTSAGGFILPGDHVDVIQAHQADTAADGAARPYVAQTLLHNIRVLAIDQTSQQPKNGTTTTVGSVATLEVSPSDAEVLAVAKARGEVVLALRSYADMGGAAAGGAMRTGNVRIIRNGQASDITVTP
jgi:pilus assembly protein CpaB